MASALTEAEYFANLCVLSEKRCLHLRLLAEELLGMAAGVLDLREGAFWIDEEEGKFQLHLDARAEIGEQARSKLVNASTTGKNELYQGVTGKIRQAVEWLAESYPAAGVPPYDICSGMMLTPYDSFRQEWSLECYRQNLRASEKAQAWDELEKSVLGKLADDVRVGVNAGRVAITISKKFS